MQTDVACESRARGRTRQAILNAAASTLARNRIATLADIADSAGVGRTTLHRYFPDRRELLAAVVEDSRQAIDRSVRDASIDHGPPLDAMHRLVAAMVDVGDRLLFLFGDPRTLEGIEPADRSAPDRDPVIDLIERGQDQGVFDREVDAAWIRRVLWGLVYTGCEAANEGGLPRHGITTTVIRTLYNGIQI
jgi:AcrR family transcriptional regulator